MDVARTDEILPRQISIQYGLPYSSKNQILGLPINMIALNNNIEGIKPVEGTVYVLVDFENLLYHTIRNGASNIWILGYPAFQEMIEDKTFKLRPQPTYCNLMGDLILYVNLPGSLKNRAAQLIMWMGGRFVLEPNHVTTHMVTSSTLAKGYRYCQTFNVPVMTVEWLEHCWNHRDLANFDLACSLTNYKIRPFTGLYLHISEKGFAPGLVDHIVTMAYDCDAELVAREDPRCTHMIVSQSASRDKTLMIAPNAAFVVNEDWVKDSFSANERLDEDYYECAELLYESTKEHNEILEIPTSESDVEEITEQVVLIVIDSDLEDSGAGDIVHNLELIEDERKTSKTKLRRSRSMCSSARSKSIELNKEEDKEDSQKKKNLVKRKHTLQELLSTERNYIKCIRALVMLKDATNKLLNKAESKMIFGNIEKILNLHDRMFNKIEAKIQAQPESATIADIIIAHKDALLEEYVHYSKQVLECQNLFAKKYNESEAFRVASDVMITVQFSGEAKDLFIRPVQRLCSICLLLKEIQKYTVNDNSEKTQLSDALSMVNGVLKQMNEGRAETDHINRLFEVYRCITGFPAYLLSSHRQYISKFNVEEYDLTKKSNGSKLVLFLFNDIILVAKATTKKGTPYKYIENISLTFVLHLVLFPEKYQGKEIFGLTMKSEEDENKTKTRLYLYAEQNHDLNDFLMVIADHLSHRDSSRNASHFIKQENLREMAKSRQSGVIHKAKKKLMSRKKKLRRSTSCSELKNLSTAL